MNEENVATSATSATDLAKTSERIFTYLAVWKYGEKPRDDCIEVTKSNNKVVNLRRWTTFKSFHFPEGAIVTGFRGRRDYKDGKCEGIMCCKWCSEKKAFTLFVFTISNGYNSTFTFYNTDAVKNIKNELR
jgi:hypothetical protein